MNKLLFFFGVIALLGLSSCFNAHSESHEEFGILSQLVKAFNESDYQQLAQQSDELLELTFENEARHYSQTQTRFALKDFFQRNPVSNFEILHSSKKQASVHYIIGNYQSSMGVYRISIRMRKIGSEYRINMMKFRKES